MAIIGLGVAEYHYQLGKITRDKCLAIRVDTTKAVLRRTDTTGNYRIGQLHIFEIPMALRERFMHYKWMKNTHELQK